MKMSRFLGATALVGALATMPNIASARDLPSAADTAQGAQTATADTPAPDDQEKQDIVVTGSRIRSANLQSTIPITSISGDELFQQGGNSIGDDLNNLPQLRSTFSQQNPGLGVGIAGLNLLDLRGLGTVRTLVLVDGRRHVGSDILNNATSVDINTIPAVLIDRVDIVTGGNSAVYGSDAIAGVVNFVLKHNYNGGEIRANAGVTTQGFGANQNLSGIYGRNFADGRGNITVAADYAHQDRVFASDIPWYRSQNGFVVTDVDTPGLPNGSDGYPDRTFFTDIRSSTISRYGLVPVTQPTTNPACGVGIAPTNGAPSTVGGAPYNCTYIFDANGRLQAQTGTRVSTGINSAVIGGNGQTGREDKLVSVYPYQQRYGFNLLSHYEIAPAADVFVEAKWVRVEALGNNAGPSFTQGTRSQFDSREQIRLDNPYLNPADRTTLANAILASGCNTSFLTSCGTGNLTAAQIAAINAGTYRFVIGKQFADVGNRDEAFTRTTWRVVGGLRGTFFSDWNYEISGNYGKFNQTTTTYGYLDKQRFLLSFDAGVNPATGQIQCRAQFDPTAAVAFPDTTYNRSRLAADIAACVPYNPFGVANNAAAAKYFQYNAVDHAQMTQFVLNGFVGGNTSKFFNLPGGPVSFVIGGEYRVETARYVQDSFSGDPATYTTSLSGLSFSPKPFRVKEGYGELNVPIVKDIPFFHELTVKGAARVSSYNGQTGTVWAYNYGGDWSPVRDIRFRANYGRAVRAPNVSETGGPLVPNFAPGFADPCRADQLGSGSQYRAANCAADLGALLTTPSFANQTSYSLAVLSGANPKLFAETSDSWTFGGVFEPRFIPHLSLSVDYYNIHVNNVIASLNAQTIAQQCYDQPTLQNQFCALFTRYRGTGLGPLGEIPGQIQGNTLLQAPVNYAKRIRKGIDTQVNYRVNISSNVTFTGNLIWTHALKSSNYTNPAIPNFENRILSELGDPVDEFQLSTDWRVGQVTFGYRLHYIGPMYLNTYEDFNSLQGRAPENADYAPISQYPSITYHDLRVQWDLKTTGGFGKAYQLYLGVDNVFDQHPPLGSTATGSGSAIYDVFGRRLYVGLKANF